MSVLQKMYKYGFKKSIIWALKKLTNSEIQKFHYLKLELDNGIIERLKANISIEYKRLEYEDFLKGDKNVFKTAKLELIKKRLNSNEYVAYGIIKDDILLYSTWVSFCKITLPHQKKTYPLLANEALLEDSYCNPIARGQGFHNQMNQVRIVNIGENNKNTIIVIVLEGNAPAFKTQIKYGFKEMGCFYSGKIAGIHFSTLDKQKYESK